MSRFPGLLAVLGLVACIDIDAELGTFAAPCGDDADCEALTCIAGRCGTAAEGEGEGEGEPPACEDTPAVAAPAGPVLLDSQLPDGLPAVITGDLVINGGVDPGRLASVRCITGDLIIDGGSHELLHFPLLEVVLGDVVIANEDDLTTIDFVAMRSVGGSVRIGTIGFDAPDEVTQLPVTRGNPLLTDLRLFALLEVGGAFEVGGNATLAEVELTSLATVGGHFAVYDNARLNIFKADNLDAVGAELFISENGEDPDFNAIASVDFSFAGLAVIGTDVADPSPVIDWAEGEDFELTLPGGLVFNRFGNNGVNEFFDTLQVPLLQSAAGGVNITNTLLKSLDLPALTSTGAVEVGGNPLLTAVRAPLLSSCCGPNRLNTFRIIGNNDLDVLAFPALTTIDGDLLLSDNDALTSLCGFQTLGDVTRALTIEGNAALPTCQALQLGDLTTPASTNIVDNAQPPATRCPITCP